MQTEIKRYSRAEAWDHIIFRGYKDKTKLAKKTEDAAMDEEREDTCALENSEESVISKKIK